jgi:gluconolactonase
MSSEPTGHLIAEGLNFPEGPAFDSRGRLWIVELKGGNLAFLEHGKLMRISVGGEPNGILDAVA